MRTGLKYVRDDLYDCNDAAAVPNSVYFDTQAYLLRDLAYSAQRKYRRAGVWDVTYDIEQEHRLRTSTHEWSRF